jgi:hypothetical protein
VALRFCDDMGYADHQPTPHKQEVLHAAVAFAGIHWGARLSFMGEMNPLVTVARACIAWHGEEEMLLLLWGECVGVLVAMVYIVNYHAPRKHRNEKKARGEVRPVAAAAPYRT